MTQEPDKTSMAKAYEPQAVEQKWYDFWLEKGYFTPETFRTVFTTLSAVRSRS